MDDPKRRTTPRKHVAQGDSIQLLGDNPVNCSDNFELESFDLQLEEGVLLDNDGKKAFPSVLMSSEGSRAISSQRAGRKKLKNTVLAMFGASVLMLLLIYNVYSSSGKHHNRSSLKPGRVKPGSQDFSIENVFKGEFLYDREAFRFIDPPQDTVVGSFQDEGLYLTVESKEDNPTFVAKKLSDTEFSKVIGKTSFTYKDESYNVSKILVSYQLDVVIYVTDIEPGFRHTSKAYYWLGDVKSNEIVPLAPRGISGNSMVKLSYAKFSPNYKFVYFVYENNLYVKDLYNGVPTKAITTDGSDNIFNGIPDWVYEEEVLASDSAVWWSPDESALVYLKLNDEDVQSQTIPKYVNDEVYPSSESVKYPKVGTKLPVARLLVYTLKTASSVELSLDAVADRILYYGKWLNKSCFMYKVSDRTSRRMDINFFELDKNKAAHIRTVDAEQYGGWIEKATEVVSIPPNNARSRGDYGYVDRMVDSEGYSHLFYFPSFFHPTGIQLTSGNWEVLSGPIKFDYGLNQIYFYANKMHPMSQQLYTVPLSGEMDENPSLLPSSADSHDYYEFEFSYGSKYSIMSYLGPNLPSISVVETSSLKQTASPNAILKLSKTAELQEAVKKYNLPISSFKSIKTDDGVILDYIEIKPAKMKSTHKYPLLVHVYGGPGSMTFNSKFNILLDRAVASGIGAIVLQIEPRGTGGKGWNFRKWAKDSIGRWEKSDIIQVTKKYIEQQHHHIDTARVAIWGWSYGGFTTLKTLEEDGGETFKYGVAVAPVTDWKSYDAIYTERYMGSPSETTNFNENSSVNNVTQFDKLDRFLLAHGTADDNVHIQNTYKFLDHLNMKNIRNFDSLIFPDSDHSISFHNAASVVYKRIYYWLANAFTGGFDNLSG